MSNWTNVAKPNARNWTNVQGYLPTYDESSVIYDSTTTYYDGSNPAAWTNVAKPKFVNTVTLKVGMTVGLLMPLTNSKQITLTVSPWININKPV